MKTQRRIFKLICTGLAFTISLIVAKLIEGFWIQSIVFWVFIVCFSIIHSLGNYVIGQNVFYRLVYRGLTFDNDRMLVILSNGLFFWLWMRFNKNREMELYLKLTANG